MISELDLELERGMAQLPPEERLKLLGQDFNFQRELGKKRQDRRALAKLPPAEKLRIWKICAGAANYSAARAERRLHLRLANWFATPSLAIPTKGKTFVQFAPKHGLIVLAVVPQRAV